MRISVAIPNGMVDVSNGKFAARPIWRRLHALGLARPLPHQQLRRLAEYRNYEHFAGRLGDLPLDFYALPEDLDKQEAIRAGQGDARSVPALLRRVSFRKDGYKLIEAPYAGMEHRARDLRQPLRQRLPGARLDGVGISPRFDFIIVTKARTSGSATASPRPTCPNVIHEAWATYLECLYVEYRWGKKTG